MVDSRWRQLHQSGAVFRDTLKPDLSNTMEASKKTREGHHQLLLNRASALVRESRPSQPPAPLAPLRPKLDRLQLTTWALLRSQQTEIAGSRSLATGGQLGASQAGARLVYNFDRRIALSARLSSEVGRRGGEAAAGVRIQPLLNIPVWLTAERRQAIGRFGGGRSAFAFFLEGGLYDRPLPWGFSFDTYLQGGVVGFRSRDLFVDGALTVTRPAFRNFSLGAGVWGGAQPGLYRVDVGPRLTMRVRHNVKVHVDWRQRIAGNARPDRARRSPSPATSSAARNLARAAVCG